MKKRWLIAPVLIIIGVADSAYSWWQSPSSTASVTSANQSNNAVLGSATSLKTWQTTYFSTQLPGSFQVKTSDEQAAAIRQGAYLLTDASRRFNDQIGVTIAPLGTSSLDELSAVRLRRNQPAMYTATTPSYLPAGGYAFSRADGTENGIFWQYNGTYIALVASSSSQRSGQLDQALQSIVSNWHWR